MDELPKDNIADFKTARGRAVARMTRYIARVLDAAHPRVSAIGSHCLHL